MTEIKNTSDNKDEIKELVIARLVAIPADKGVSIGAIGEQLSRDQLIENVQKETEIGKKIIEIEMNFLRALKDGVFYSEEYAFDN